MAETYLQLNHLSVGYQKHAVISGIDLDIKKGEVIALIGPNGAGKSTILKTLSRALPIIEGNIVLDGKDLLAYPSRELSMKMAVILTDRIKVELMTCRDIVATGRYPYTGRLGILSEEDNARVDEAIAAVHAEEIALKDYNAISDGQRQRILLARAVCQDPELILLDEPTSFLDVKHKLELLSILTNMARKKNITVITSLHEIDLAEKVADRIVTVKGQEVFGYGEPSEVFSEEGIRKLYDIDNGFFDPLFGNIELQKPAGDVPQVFVIAGGSSGIPVFRDLQRKNIPFATGILYPNENDYQVGRLFATEVIMEKAYCTITAETLERAKKLMETCPYIIDAGAETGEMNAAVEELRRIAKASGKLTTAEALAPIRTADEA